MQKLVDDYDVDYAENIMGNTDRADYTKQRYPVVRALLLEVVEYSREVEAFGLTLERAARIRRIGRKYFSTLGAVHRHRDRGAVLRQLQDIRA